MTANSSNNFDEDSVEVSSALKRLLAGTLHDPFTVLGKHPSSVNGCVVRAHIPGAVAVYIQVPSSPMHRTKYGDIFEYQATSELPQHYQLHWQYADGTEHSAIDPYSFSPLIDDLDLYLIGTGSHQQVHNILGANTRVVDGVKGVLFATWAPNAERISVVGDFNGWDNRRHPMRCRGESGIWELFIPEVESGNCYKFEIFHNAKAVQKSDPCGQHFEVRPKTASRVKVEEPFLWQDDAWLQHRQSSNWAQKAVSIYELHAGSWRRNADGSFLNYRELAHELVPYSKAMGFTHIELLPITEHPFDGSWGYQTIGYFAPTSRFGSPDDFRYFVDYCHQHNIAVLLDWVASHFPKDEHGLRLYDGTSLYEHSDINKAEHPDWGTLIFNYGRNEVKSFLISNVLFWLKEFHLDGLRVDAVASMIYLDYSREPRTWAPNCFGGNENLEAVNFLKELNEIAHDKAPGTLIIAEESTAWPMVSRPTYVGGLGFSMKWNMGWMHDSLDYMQKDPVHRRYHHEKLTFSMMYAFNENFVLALSHDEVVHGKSSLINKMPGDDWQQFANLRLLYSYMFTYPGKKLLFMGAEFAQRNEWNHDTELQWDLLNYAAHQHIQRLITDLNGIYKQYPALHQRDFEQDGFQWINCHDSDQSVLSYLRHSADQHLAVVLNFTPVPRLNYRIGVPRANHYFEVLNSDSEYYGGSNMGNMAPLPVEDIPCMGYSHSISLTVPPLAALVIIPGE